MEINVMFVKYVSMVKCSRAFDQIDFEQFIALWWNFAAKISIDIVIYFACITFVRLVTTAFSLTTVILNH